MTGGNIMHDIHLVALDLDGTLFDNNSRISPRNLATIKKISNMGVHVVISTGRPFGGLPFEQLHGTGIEYAITANGSAIYEIATEKCLFEESMDEDTLFPILDFLLKKDIHMDAFISGKGYSPIQCIQAGQKLTVPASIKHYITNTRTRVDNLPQFIHDNQLKVQKMTLNFFPDEKGVLKDRDSVREFLESNTSITCVCGGYNNLEFTRAGVSKGTALHRLAALLDIEPSATMAIGDSENDLAILEAAGIGVAMDNAAPVVRKHADYITASNTADGVAAAIEHFIPAVLKS